MRTKPYLIAAFLLLAAGQLPAQTAPQAVSLIPIGNSGSTQTFTARYHDNDGASDLYQAVVLFAGSSSQIANACYLAVGLNSKRIGLADNSGNFTLGYINAGDTTRISNSQCIIYAAGTSIIRASDAPNTDYILNLMVSFKSTFTGQQSMSTYAMDYSGLFSTVLTPGNFTVMAPSGPALTITSTHSGVFTQNQTGATYTLTVANLVGGANPSGTVTVTETVPTGMTLVSMSGGGWNCPGGGNTCNRADTPTNGVYPDITVTVNIGTPAATVYNQATVSGGGSASASTSDPTAVYNSPVSITSVTPASQGGGFGWYSITANDTIGFDDLTNISLLITGGDSSSTANACYVRFNRAARTISLADDSGAFNSTGRPIGVLSPQDNSQCMVRGDWDSTSTSGTSSYTVNLLVHFKPAFNSNNVYKNVYAKAAGVTNAPGWASGWNANVWQTARPVSLSTTPVSGYGLSGQFTLTAEETFSNDARNLQWIDLWLTANVQGIPHSCYVRYDWNISKLRLYDDTASAFLDVTPGTGQQSNARCTLKGSGSSRSSDGATTTFNFDFDPLHPAVYSIYAYATGTYFSSGWYRMGTFTAGSAQSTSIYPNTTIPNVPFTPTVYALTVGTKFRADSPGHVLGMRFYKGAGNNGNHVGLLYDRNGTLLMDTDGNPAKATFFMETASGWQQASFPAPVPIAANTTYVAAFYTDSGFPQDLNYFTNTGWDNGPLHALKSGIDGPNNVYSYNQTPSFPTSVYADQNNYTDIMYVPSGSFNISGTVTSGGAALANATVNLTFRGTLLTPKTTDSSGAYQFISLPPGGPYVVTPSKGTSVFSPPSLTMANLVTNWTVPPFATVAPTITTSSLPAGYIGASYSQALTASGGSTPYTWSLSAGTLPSGLTLSTQGVLSGTPTVAATSIPTFRVTGADNAFSTRQLSITVTPPPALTITSAHSGNFTQADAGDTYTLTVSNTAGAGPTNGSTVMVTEFIPAGVVPTSIAGTGWTCTQPAGPCSRTDLLAGGVSHPPITLTVSVAPNAPATATNAVAVSGGGSPSNSASDATTINAVPRYSNPLAFAVPASVVAGVPATFSVTYTSDNGPADIASGQVKIDNCYLQWDSAGNVRLYGGSNGYLDATGTLGQSSVLWAGNCSINLLNSNLSTPANNPRALVLTLNITFSAQDFLTSPYTEFVGQHEVYAWGTSAGGLSTGQIDLGALVVSQGQDFTLSVTPGGGNSITVPNGGSAVLYVTTTGLNGFNGTITVFVTHASGSTCLNSTLASFPMSGNAQTSFSVQNLGCPNGATAQFNVTGQTNWGAPNQLQRNGAASATMVAGTTGDFTVTVNSPSNPTLSPAGSVSYPVAVQSINGQSGSVGLSASGLPTGVTSQFSPATLSLSANGVGYSTLTLNGSASMPGGSFPITVRALIGSVQRTASFTMGTQSTTFQVTSVTGGAIVHNTGQEVQVTHTVPANNAPTYTTCDTPDPNVTCRVMSSSAGTVTLGVTASTSTIHGTRTLRLNGGASMALAMVADSGFVGGLPTITVQAGGFATTYTYVSVPPCYIDGPCAFVTVEGSDPWIFGFGDFVGQVTVFAGPPQAAQPGDSYWYSVNTCSGFSHPDDPDDDEDCFTGLGAVVVTAPPPPPPPPPPVVLPTVTITRQSLLNFTATATPSGGTFAYSAVPTSYPYSFPVHLVSPVVQFDGVSPQANPNAGVLSNPLNPCGGTPCAGSVAFIQATYTPTQQPPPPYVPVMASDQFMVSTFGMSCYVTALQAEWGTAPGSCQPSPYGAAYNGYTVNPPGTMPPGSYCNSFLKELRVEGSAILADGNTLVQFNSGQYVVRPNGIRTHDGTLPVPGGTVARDLNVIPSVGTTVNVTGVGNNLRADDTGGAILGYRLDFYGGLGRHACDAYSGNPMAISACSPAQPNCPSATQH